MTHPELMSAPVTGGGAAGAPQGDAGGGSPNNSSPTDGLAAAGSPPNGLTGAPARAQKKQTEVRGAWLNWQAGALLSKFQQKFDDAVGKLQCSLRTTVQLKFQNQEASLDALFWKQAEAVSSRLNASKQKAQSEANIERNKCLQVQSS